ncbi:ATPase, T2SS/T4P/T4SS family, partial [Candidatus Undinarchaeota archaeon]
PGRGMLGCDFTVVIEVTVEDTLELPIEKLRQLDFNVVSMKVQSAISKLEAEIPADEGIRTALRLGDSCLIVGEVRSLEAKALYEAMRVGALSNLVAGTIHGDTPYGIFDRVVHDLGVAPTSFKATDLIVMPKPVMSPDGLSRLRRLINITEVRKDWVEDPGRENGFADLLKYNAAKDVIEPTEVLLNGESWLLNNIASSIRGWKGEWEKVWSDIKLRSQMVKSTVDYKKKYNIPQISASSGFLV